MPALSFELQTVDGAETATSLLMAGMLFAAVYTDFRRGRIPNWLTLGGAALGLVLNLLASGFAGGVSSAEGWLLGTALFFLFFALGAMGAGDVKLLAAVGALKGPSFVFNAFLLTGLAGGVFAILVVVYRRKVAFAFAGLTRQVESLVYTGGISRRGDPKASPLRFPYGLAIAAGSMAALFWRL